MPQAMPSKYTYKPLETPTSVRLLEILPASEDQVSCALIDASLDDEPQYAALSYTWGCPFWDYNFEHSEDPAVFNEPNNKYSTDLNCTIICNGYSLLVTRNLLEALEALRDGPLATTGGQYLWVDAICTNQEDIPERNSQVAMMGRIYAMARTVVVWLGESLPRTSVAIQILETLAEIPPSKYKMMKSWGPDNPMPYHLLNLKIIERPDWSIFLSFIRRRWFERLWIMQEAVLAFRIMVLCGSKTLEWDTIVRACQCLFESSWHSQLTHFVLEGFDRSSSPSWLPGKTPISISRLCGAIDETNSKQEHMSLSIVLQQGRSSGASDPRDRIFALTSLVSMLVFPPHRQTQMTFIAPDYKSNGAEIFAQACYKTFEIDASLMVLEFLEDPACREMHDLPSWCPDWSVAPAPRSIFNLAGQHWRPALGVPFKLPVLYTPRVLGIKAAYFDKVIACVKRRMDPEPLSDFVNKWATWIIALLCIRSVSPAQGGLIETLWRTVILDVYHETYPAPPEVIFAFLNSILFDLTYLYAPSVENEEPRYQEYKESFHLVLDLLSILSSLDPFSVISPKITRDTLIIMAKYLHDVPGSDNFRRMISSAAEFGSQYSEHMSVERQLVVTQKGLLGCSSLSVQPGDEVWILPGANIPFILRKQITGHFSVINAAYVHGIMCGEAIEAGDLVFGDISLQ